MEFTVKNGIKFGFGLAIGKALYMVVDTLAARALPSPGIVAEKIANVIFGPMDKQTKRMATMQKTYGPRKGPDA